MLASQKLTGQAGSSGAEGALADEAEGGGQAMYGGESSSAYDMAIDPEGHGGVAGYSQAQDTETEGNWIEVNVKHDHNGYHFKDVKGKTRTTDRSQWEKKWLEGQKLYVYRGTRTVYYTKQLYSLRSN